MTQTMNKAAVLGLGLMGFGMAKSLLAAGFDVTVWNRSPDKAAPLVAGGARLAATPGQAAAGADVVIAMLADDTVSRAVWLGTDGALAAMNAGAIAVDSSTLTEGWTKELAGEAEALGLSFLEAPVTGSRDQAAGGMLRFLVGGKAEVLASARPAFDAMGSAVVHLGDVGSAAVVKLVNNFLCGVQVASLAEALAMFETRGLDVAQALSILTEGAPGSPIIKGVSARMVERAYDPHFAVELMAKDLGYAAQTLAKAGIHSAIADAARARFVEADQAGVGRRDIAAVIDPLRKALLD